MKGRINAIGGVTPTALADAFAALIDERSPKDSPMQVLYVGVIQRMAYDVAGVTPGDMHPGTRQSIRDQAIYDLIHTDCRYLAELAGLDDEWFCERARAFVGAIKAAGQQGSTGA